MTGHCPNSPAPQVLRHRRARPSRNGAPVAFDCFARLVLAPTSERAAPREPTLARGLFLSERTKAGSSLALPLQRV